MSKRISLHIAFGALALASGCASANSDDGVELGDAGSLGGSAGAGTAQGGSSSTSGGTTGQGGTSSGGTTNSASSGGAHFNGGSSSGGASASGGSASGGRTGSSGGATSSGGTSAGGVTGSMGGIGSGGGALGGTSSSMGGSTNVAGSSGTGCTVQFAAGVNVAWFNFARDVPSPRLSDFKTLFDNTHAAGGRVIRWWLHTDGSTTPGYDGSGYAKALPAQTIADIKSVLDAAVTAGVAINISLWSFDMLKQGPTANNKLLLTNDTNRQKYIDNTLIPMVTALKGHKGLYSWEIFNEPEGMSNEFGWTTDKIAMSDVQKTVNWLADAIHTADSGARVTNGCWSFPACSNISGNKNYYADTELVKVGGRAKGTLDFYEVHYYSSNGVNASPFTHPASYWKLDKPIVMGEFWSKDTDGVNKDDLFTKLYDTGYAGAWAWQYANSDGSGNDYRWPAMQKGLQNVLAAHPTSLNLVCP